MTDGSIAWDLIARDKASPAFDQVAKKAGSTGGAFDGLNKSTSKLSSGFGALAAGGALTTAIDVIGKLSAASSDLTEAQNAVNVTFGSGAAIIADFADGAARNLGLSETAALQMSGAFGGLFTNIGATGNQAAILSRGVLQLGADLASLKNLRTEDALEKIRSGLTGEAEPLRAVGVFLSEAAVKSKALELGLVGAHGELSEGEKVIARYELIMEQLTVAQGDFANTSDGLANAQRTAEASMSDLAATAGGALAPTLANVAVNMGVLARFTDDLIEKMGGGKGGLGKVVNFLFEALNPLGQLSKVVGDLDEQFGDGESSVDVYAETAAALPDILKDIAAAGGAAGGAIDAITKAQTSAIDATFGFGDSQSRLHDAQRTLTNAQQDYADALKGTGKYADQQAAATDRLRSAQESLLRTQRRARDLTESVADSQAKLTEAVFHYGAGSKQAQDAARDLRKDQESLGDAQSDVADSTDDVKKAQDELARVRDLSDARREAADKLTDAQRNLERAVYNAAKSEVELGTQMGAARGETFTATQHTDLLRGAIERLRDTAIPADSPVMAGLAALLGLLAPPGQSAFESFRAGERAFSDTPTFGSGPAALPASGLASGAVGAGGLQAQSSGHQVVFNYPVPADQVAAYVEASTRTAY